MYFLRKYYTKLFAIALAHMNKIKKLLFKVFSFSKTEANGSVVLILLIVLCLAMPAIYKSIFGLRYVGFKEDKALLDSLISQMNVKPRKPEILKPIPKIFNPNTASASKLVSLGVPLFLARRVENFRKAGGIFRVKGDLAKIYDFPDSLYQSLQSYIDLPENLIEEDEVKEQGSPVPVKRNASARVVQKKQRYNEVPLIIDINTADTTEFKRLYGIGSGYSRQIVSFREALGGFHSVDQLKDMYGMKDSLFLQIKSFLHVSDTVTLESISINIATFKQLNAHPYISYELTKEILSAKSKYGKFKKADDLKRLKLIDSVTIQKLVPYLKF